MLPDKTELKAPDERSYRDPNRDADWANDLEDTIFKAAEALVPYTAESVNAMVVEGYTTLGYGRAGYAAGPIKLLASVVQEYLYGGKKYSVNNINYVCLEVHNLPITKTAEYLNFKDTMENLFKKGYIKPFLTFVSGFFYKWSELTIIKDAKITYILFRIHSYDPWDFKKYILNHEYGDINDDLVFYYLPFNIAYNETGTGTTTKLNGTTKVDTEIFRFSDKGLSDETGKTVITLKSQHIIYETATATSFNKYRLNMNYKYDARLGAALCFVEGELDKCDPWEFEKYNYNIIDLYPGTTDWWINPTTLVNTAKVQFKIFYDTRLNITKSYINTKIGDSAYLASEGTKKTIPSELKPLYESFSPDSGSSSIYENRIRKMSNSIANYDYTLYNSLFNQYDYIISTEKGGSSMNNCISNGKFKLLLNKDFRQNEDNNCHPMDAGIMVFVNGDLLPESYTEVRTANRVEFSRSTKFNLSDKIESLRFLGVDNRLFRSSFRDEYVTTADLTTIRFNIIGKDLWVRTLPPSTVDGHVINPDDIYLKTSQDFVKMIDLYSLELFTDVLPAGEDFTMTSNDGRMKAKIPHEIRDFTNPDGSIDTYIVFSLDYEYCMNSELTLAPMNQFHHFGMIADTAIINIQLPEEFNYAVNHDQYMIFVNGKYIDSSKYRIASAKYNKPFDDISIYMQYEVTPGDTFDVYYVPYPSSRITTEKIPSNGMLKFLDSSNFSSSAYAMFVNGKKIPPSQLKNLTKNEVAITADIGSSDNMSIIFFNRVDEMLRNFSSTFDETIAALPDKTVRDIFSINTDITTKNTDIYTTTVSKTEMIYEMVRDYWLSTRVYDGSIFVYDYDGDIVISDVDNGTALFEVQNGNMVFERDLKPIAEDIGTTDNIFVKEEDISTYREENPNISALPTDQVSAGDNYEIFVYFRSGSDHKW